MLPDTKGSRKGGASKGSHFESKFEAIEGVISHVSSAVPVERVNTIILYLRREIYTEVQGSYNITIQLNTSCITGKQSSLQYYGVRY